MPFFFDHQNNPLILLETYGLFKLNEYVRRVIALNFQDTIWITAEISQVSFSRGNYYLDLIEKQEGSDTIIAKASAILWYKKSIFLKKKFADLFESIMDTGNEIRIKIRVEFSERYGFSLVIEDLDPSFTLGKAEMLKQQILAKLEKEQLIQKNAALELPIVLQKIAIISSPTAAGYKDFISHLDENAYQYHYSYKLFASAMQGTAVESELVKAMESIEADQIAYDCIVIIRGGGAKLDLAAFDNYVIAKKIANCKYPVITGIGHDIDQSIADIVSHTDVKTPTAVADFLVLHNQNYESRILDLGLQIQVAFKNILQDNNSKLNLLLEQVSHAYAFRKQSEIQKLNEADNNLNHFSKHLLSDQRNLLKSIEKQIKILSPQNIMKRGFSILRKNGVAIKSVTDLKANDEVESEFIDGIVKSVIKK